MVSYQLKYFEIYELFKDYLDGRGYKVAMSKRLNNERKIAYGVSQGKFLGSFQFLIYIN